MPHQRKLAWSSQKKTHSRTRVGDKLSEIRANTNSEFQLPWVQVRLKQGQGLTHRNEMADFDKSHQRVTNQLDHYSQNSNVFHRHSGISRKDSPNGQTTHEVFSMVSENPLEILPIFENSNTMLRF